MNGSKILYLFSFLILSMISCQTETIPEVLKKHKDRGLFSKLDDKSNSYIDLFNGKDLTGFYTYTNKYGRNNDVEKAFNVTDNLLHFAGESMGYLCTNDSYKNYYLKVVFRWGEKKYAPRLNEKRDSGILYHFPVDRKDQVWPHSIECQIQEGDCGDCWLVDGAKAESINLFQREDRIVRTDNFENPGSEWNTIEIICYDSNAEHYVNGQKVNEIYNINPTGGKILLQLECAEIYYKSVRLLLLK